MEGMVGKVEEKGNATAKVIKVRGLWSNFHFQISAHRQTKANP
jgi:hypothetical protein